MLSRISALVVWALVAAALVFWGLRLVVRPPGAPSNAVSVGDATVVRGDLTRLLGAPPPAAATPVATVEGASRFRLLGVMAPRRSSDRTGGVALIAVDGKPARAYTVGAPLDESLVLQSVSLRAASLGPAQGPAAMTLEMPPLPTVATGTLPVIGGVPVPAMRQVPSFQPVAARPIPPTSNNPPMAFPGNNLPPMQRGEPGTSAQ